MKTSFPFLIAALAIVGCSNGDSGSYQKAPHLDFECSFFDAIECVAANVDKPVFIGLEEDTTADCASKMALLSGIQLTQAFDYSSWTVTKDQGGVLTGVASEWVNSSSMPVVTLPARVFKVCAFIDINENDQIDVNEPLHESTLAIGQPFNPLSTWVNY